MSNKVISNVIILPIGTLTLTLAFILHMFLNTDDTIDKNILNIKCCFVLNKDIDIATIKEISETNSYITNLFNTDIKFYLLLNKIT